MINTDDTNRLTYSGSSVTINPLQSVVKRQKAGEAIGVFSVCSSNWDVITASFSHAKQKDSYLLIEPTVNQVNQFGGYTGMTPVDFVSRIKATAEEKNFPWNRLILGGDHLGPNPWKSETAETAMKYSRELVRDYVLQGFKKIHLDTSMRCKADPGEPGTPLDDAIVAERAAELCQVAEAAYHEISEQSYPPAYVIGTEVPIPGGAEGELEALQVTSSDAVRQTIETARTKFSEQGLEEAWKRVLAVVVQPGVEFGDASVHEYRRSEASQISRFIKAEDTLVFEAHSTDYQLEKHLRQLVEDQFAILKVGPWLTYAFREGVFALAKIEAELFKNSKSADLSDFEQTLESVMVSNPEHWRQHYHGDENQLRIARKFSYSDRSRYYWQQDEVRQSYHQLLSNLNSITIPETLLSQYLPYQYVAVRNRAIPNKPSSILEHKITEILDIYSRATRFDHL